MAGRLWAFWKGIILKPETTDVTENIEGSVWVNGTDNEIRSYLDSAVRTVVTEDQVQDITNKNIDSDLNTITNIVNADIKAAAGIEESKLDLDYPTATLNTTITDHIADVSDAHDASAISYDNTTSVLVATDVQAAIDETEGRIDDVEQDISDHIADLVGAHAASAISVTPAGNLGSIEVQAALEELQGDIDAITGASYVNSFNTRTGAVTSQASDYDADQVDYDNAISGLTATDVQEAIDEVEGRLVTQETDLSTHVGLSANVHGVTGDVVGTTDTQVISGKEFSDALLLNEIVTPANPAANKHKIYPKNTGKLYHLNSAGLEVPLGGSGYDLQGSFTVANNQSSPANVTDFVLNPAEGEFAKVDYSIVRKYDGQNFWTGVSSSNETNSWYGMEYGDGKFVAVSWNGTNRVMRSINNGLSWTGYAASDESSFWRDVAYAPPSISFPNGLFVAVASAGTNRAMYSIDGTSWTNGTGVPANSWHSVTYGNGKFVAVASSGTNRVMYSTDGISWTAVASANETNSWWGINYGNGLFVAVSADGSNRVMYSSDGISWTGVASANELAAWRSVVYGNGIFVAVSNNLNKTMYSSNGISWSLSSTLVSDGWSSVTFGDGIFFSVANVGTNKTMYSSDGISWVEVPASNTGNSWSVVTFGNGKFVSVAQTGSNRAMYYTIINPSYLRESGFFYIQYNDDTTDWTITGETFAGTDAEVDLSVSGNQVQYESSNIAGTLSKSILNFYLKYL